MNGKPSDNKLFELRRALKQVLSFTGRETRTGFAIFFLLGVGLQIMILLLVEEDAGWKNTVVDLIFGDDHSAAQAIALVYSPMLYIKGLALILSGIMGYYQVVVTVRRLHDLGRRGWHYFFLFVPLYNLYMLLFLLFKAGSKTGNSFGPPPLTDKAAIFSRLPFLAISVLSLFLCSSQGASFFVRWSLPSALRRPNTEEQKMLSFNSRAIREAGYTNVYDGLELVKYSASQFYYDAYLWTEVKGSKATVVLWSKIVKYEEQGGTPIRSVAEDLGRALFVYLRRGSSTPVIRNVTVATDKGEILSNIDNP